MLSRRACVVWCSPPKAPRRALSAELSIEKSLAMHPMFAATPPPGAADIKLVHGTWQDKFVVINKPPGLASQQVPDRLRAMGVLKAADRVFFPHRLDKHTEGLMVLAFDRFAGTLLSRDLEAGRWSRKYRAVVDKPPCSEKGGFPERCCLSLSLVQGKLIEGKNLVKKPVQIASFIARSGTSSPETEEGGWRKREEQKRRESCAPHCEAAAAFSSLENPVPATLRWQSVTEMHPEAKLCITNVTYLKEDAKHVLYEVRPGTGRPHQMRVHLAELGFPIVSDPYYNHSWLARQLKMSPEQWAAEESLMLLQAYSLELPNPFEATQITDIQLRCEVQRYPLWKFLAIDDDLRSHHLWCGCCGAICFTCQFRQVTLDKRLAGQIVSFLQATMTDALAARPHTLPPGTFNSSNVQTDRMQPSSSESALSTLAAASTAWSDTPLPSVHQWHVPQASTVSLMSAHSDPAVCIAMWHCASQRLVSCSPNLATLLERPLMQLQRGFSWPGLFEMDPLPPAIARSRNLLSQAFSHISKGLAHGGTGVLMTSLLRAGRPRWFVFEFATSMKPGHPSAFLVTFIRETFPAAEPWLQLQDSAEDVDRQMVAAPTRRRNAVKHPWDANVMHFKMTSTH